MSMEIRNELYLVQLKHYLRDTIKLETKFVMYDKKLYRLIAFVWTTYIHNVDISNIQ